METVNFQCGHCQQLLAVSKQHLGQQVRCPHCQQVVVAPPSEPAAAAPAPAPPPSATLDSTFPFSPPDELDSIFSAPTESDDLFGQAPSARVEMPPDIPPSTAAAPHPDAFPRLELQPSQPASILPFGESTLTYSPGEPSTFGATVAPEAAPAAAPAAEHGGMVFGGAEGTTAGDEDLASAFTPARPRVSRGWHIALFIIPLISYSILATVAAGILFFRMKQEEARPHPLEQVPDINGDHPTRKKDPTQGVRFPNPTGELPAKLKLALGQTLRLGEVEVTPEAVTRGPIATKNESESKAQPMEGMALKLYLKIKNVSPDLAFYPMDSYFTRCWQGGAKMPHDSYPTSSPPYTQLVIGKHRFYGGPAAWNPRGNGHPREKVVGQNFQKLLKPGEEMTTFICTDPEDKTLQAQLKEHKGQPLLWRVQLRRGSIEVKGRRIPVSCVIGVEFTDKQITNRE